MMHCCMNQMMEQSAMRAPFACAFLEDTAAKAVSSFAFIRLAAIRITRGNLGLGE